MYLPNVFRSLVTPSSAPSPLRPCSRSHHLVEDHDGTGRLSRCDQAAQKRRLGHDAAGRAHHWLDQYRGKVIGVFADQPFALVEVIELAEHERVRRVPGATPEPK